MNNLSKYKMFCWATIPGKETQQLEDPMTDRTVFQVIYGVSCLWHNNNDWYGENVFSIQLSFAWAWESGLQLHKFIESPL